jgi:TolA-binding protein
MPEYALINELQSQIAVLEERALQAAENGGLDIEMNGVLTAITLNNEQITGERAGKPENLKIARTERQFIRIQDAIDKLRIQISKENQNYSRTQEKIAKVKHIRTLSVVDDDEPNAGLLAIAAAINRSKDENARSKYAQTNGATTPAHETI